MKKNKIYICISPLSSPSCQKAAVGLLAYDRNHVACSKMPWMHTQTQTVGFNACIREIEGS